LSRLEIWCDYTFESDLTRFLGGEPIANGFAIAVEGGAITEGNNLRFNDRADEVWQTFHEWVTSNHPDDVERMYNADGDLPVLDDTSIELWERYVDEVASG
jgi:hypothetical protein